MQPIRKPLAGFAIALILTATTTSAHADQTAKDYRKLVESKNPALVTLKYVLRISMGGQPQERETETTGVMIEPDGLILCANTPLGGIVDVMARMRGGAGSMSAKPTDIKILIGNDTEGVDGVFQARDTELDLAWIRIKEPGDKKYEFVDLSKSAAVEIGDPILAVRRLGEHFARKPAIIEGRIAGSTDKPRDLLVPSGDFSDALGLPLFTVDGSVLGVLVTQFPDTPGSAGGLNSSMQEMMQGMILPVDTVITATDRAKKQKPIEEEEEALEDAPDKATEQPSDLEDLEDLEDVEEQE